MRYDYHQLSFDQTERHLESYVGMIDNDENETYKNHDEHDDYTRYYNF